VNLVRDRAWIEAHLPHKGGMNLLDTIASWDATSIRAIARSHRDANHPLRRDGELPIVCGIEYGAQAAAAHGALSSAHASPVGFLASVRGVRFHASRLDDVTGDLDIHATQQGAGAGGVVYAFTVSSGGRILVEGRVAVAFAK
jgi:predicted hotdog family 3-hydroxylacyl-ACP dehydratase